LSTTPSHPYIYYYILNSKKSTKNKLVEKRKFIMKLWVLLIKLQKIIKKINLIIKVIKIITIIMKKIT